jgi:3-isopropylmalate dehydrogenase
MSLAMLMRYSLERGDVADAIEAAVEHVLDQGLRTADIYTEGTRKVGTEEMGSAVADALSKA